MPHHTGASRRFKMQMLIGLAFGFLGVVMLGVAFADDTPTSPPAQPAVELAPAVVVAAGADSVDTSAVARLTVADAQGVHHGSAFQLDDGRVVSVAHLLADARVAVLNDPADKTLDLSTASISRLHDVAAVVADQLPGSLSIGEEGGQVGQIVALAGVPNTGRLEVMTGKIIGRTTGTDYGIGRPDVYVISTAVEPGWSGGPVVDASGEVIAVIIGVEKNSGVTLAVPIEHLRHP